MTEGVPVGAVLVDTDVWSALYGRRRDPSPRANRWRQLTAGRAVVISA